MYKTIFAALIAISSSVLPALADSYSKPKGYWSNYSAGGMALNDGNAYGGKTSTWSSTHKNVYGGTDLDMGGVNSVYAGSHFSTSGGAYSYDKGYGYSGSFTSESGIVSGGASISWGKGTLVD